MVTIIMAILLTACAAAVIYSFTKAKKPVKTAVKSALCGLSAMLLVNMTSSATGCYIAINFFNVFVATVLSLPGIIGLVTLNMVFM